MSAVKAMDKDAQVDIVAEIKHMLPDDPAQLVEVLEAGPWKHVFKTTIFHPTGLFCVVHYRATMLCRGRPPSSSMTCQLGA